MKKILKKIFAIIALLLLLNINNVNALQRGDYLKLDDYTIGHYLTFKNVEHAKYPPFGYNGTLESDESVQYAAFCLDPGFKYNSNMQVKRLLLEENASEMQNAKDWGLLNVLDNYDGVNFLAIENAVRMYIAAVNWVQNDYFGTMGKDSDTERCKKVNDHIKFKAYAGNVYLMLKDDSNLQNAYKKVTSKDYTFLLDRFCLDKNKVVHYVDENTDDSITPALEYVKKGLLAAASYSGDSSVVPRLTWEVEQVVDTDENGTKLAIVKADISYIDNFALDTISINLGKNIINAELLGVSTYSTTDISAYEHKENINSGNSVSTYYLGFLINHIVPEEGQTIEGNILLEYYNNIGKALSGAILEPRGSGLQRFVVFSKSSSIYETLSIPLSAKPDDITIEEKDPCDPELNLPPVCEDVTKNENEDATVSYSFKEGVKDGTPSIIACIVENTDIAANDYQLIDDRAEVVVDNPYCAVYCKEDYIFDLPQHQHVDNGRYFSIRFAMKGQQDCYLSKMNKDQFNKDMIEAQERIVAAYNSWLEYYELAHAKEDGKLVVDYLSKKTYTNTAWTYEIPESDEDDEDEEEEEKVRELHQVDRTEDPETTFYDKKVNFTGTYYAFNSATGKASTTTAKPTKTFYNEIHRNQYANITIDGRGTINAVSIDGKTIINPIDNKVTYTLTIDRDKDGKLDEYSITFNEDTDGDGWPDHNITFSGNVDVDLSSFSNKSKYEDEVNYIISKTIDKKYVSDDASYAGEIYYTVSKTADELYDQAQPGYVIYEREWLTELRNRISAMHMIIDQYNSCMDDDDYLAYSNAYKNSHTWDMIYDYDPEIVYNYQEPDPTDIDGPKWITEAQKLGADIMEPVKVDPNSDDPAEYVKAGECDETVDGICQTVESVDLIFGGTSPVKEYCKEASLDKETYECSNGTSSPTYTEESYFSCYISESEEVTCGYTPYKVTNISYLHKVAVAGGTYDTPRVYYSYHTDGSVVIAETNPNENKYEIVKGLPVGINTPYGLYYYSISLNNIGKYYNTGELGRIYSGNDNSVVMVANESSETIDGDTIDPNEYVCTYDVPHETSSPDKWCKVYNDGYWICPTEEFNEDDCELQLTRDAAVSATTYNDECAETTENPETYCVTHNDEYWVCEQDYWTDTDDCTNYHGDIDGARNASTHKDGCQEGEKYCVIYHDKYYVCSQDTYSAKKCSQPFESKALALASSDPNHREGCYEKTYCKILNGSYHVCTKKNSGKEVCVDYGDDKARAIDDSDDDSQCGAVWCIKHKDEYYSCLQDHYEKNTCQHHNTRSQAEQASDIDKRDGCEDIGKWCVKHDTHYYVCPNNYYDKDACEEIDTAKDAKNSKIADFNLNCDTTYCIKHEENGVETYNICEFSTYIKDSCKATTKDEAIKSDVNINCDSISTTYCRKHGGGYYICPENKWDHDCTLAEGGLEEAITIAKNPGDCVEEQSYCVVHDNVPYVCLNDHYVKEECEDFDTMRDAIIASKKNISCTGGKVCVSGKGDDKSYYVCTEKNADTSDGTKCTGYATRKAAIEATGDDGDKTDCMRYCVVKDGRYYSCKTKEYSDKAGDCELHADAKSAIDASDSQGDCPYSPPNGKYCVKEGNGYYVCSTREFSEDTCGVRYTSKLKALEEVGCSIDDPSCPYANNCKCPYCDVSCYGTCIMKSTKDTSNDTVYELLFRYNSITPAKVNINDREMGYNWDVNNPKNVLVARKAANTISEIEARANITNVPSGRELEEVESYDFKITLSPSVTDWVREYNKSQLNSGSYNNDTIECYNYDIDRGSGFDSEVACNEAGYFWEDGSCVMPNIFCYSSFIDELIDGNPNAVDDDTMARRNNAKSASFRNYEAFSSLPYTETQIVTNDYWTIYVYDRLDINGDGVPDIGPSWK